MNSFAENGDRFIVPFTPIGLPQGFEACWAGAHPFRQGLCFGSLDGRILFTDEEGVPLRQPGEGSASQEAINGVACLGTWVVVTTRQEVNFWPLPGTEGGHPFGFVFPYGAHDITTTPSGYFIAPLGRTGIMVEQPPFRPETDVTVHSDDKAGFYAYRVIGLRSQASGEVLACACRLGGIAAGEFSGAQQKLSMTTATFKGLDVVDICPLDPGVDSLAVAALGRDGTLILSQDVLQDKKPFTMKFSSVKGIAYRVLSCRGDLYVLTSKGMYVLGELASRFLAKELVHGISTPVLPLPMEAVDVNLVANRWLLVVMANEVRKFDADLIHQSIPDQLRHGEFKEFQEATFNPDWQRFDIAQTTKQIAIVA
ncbi:MAG: hypothetical protein ACRELG_00185 [Gemmataceae bacterium]